MDVSNLPVTFGDVEAAAARLRGHTVRTPLLESELLNDRLGGRLLLKPECLQRTGSFKFRGAFNAVSQTAAPSVVAFSSGNHAQGVAAAARLLGKRATVVMPSDAPRIKLENTKALGAEIVTYDRHTANREEIGERIVRETGAALVRPYDDPRVMAGQGTVGLELAQDARALGVELHAVLVCCGGGGLIAGTATALKALSPRVAVYAVEPQGFDDTARSLALGRRVGNEPGSSSICDALLAPRPGELTFAVNRELLEGGFAVSDAEVHHAMRVAFHRFKIVAEPGGAVALAAVLADRLPIAGKNVAVVVSGGNVDPARFAEVVAGSDDAPG